MPIYYFDTSDGRSFVQDEDGIALPNDETARRCSLDGLADMAHDAAHVRDREDFLVRVRDEAGREVYEARLTLNGRWLNATVAEAGAPRARQDAGEAVAAG